MADKPVGRAVSGSLSDEPTAWYTRARMNDGIHIDYLRPQEETETPHEYSDDGVDLTLIRWMLSLTPAERLQVLQDHINSIQKLRSDRDCD